MKRDQMISRAKIVSQPFCTKCLSTVRLHAHHIHALADGGADELANLDTLCSFCHNEWHGSAEGVMDYAQYITLPPGRFFAMMSIMPEYRHMTMDDLISVWPELKAKGVGEPLAKSARGDRTKAGREAARASLEATGRTHRGKSSLGRPFAHDPSTVVKWRADNEASIAVTAKHFGVSVSTVKRCERLVK